MFTTWQQVEEWLRDNAFDHWIFSVDKPCNDDKVTKIVDSDYYAGDYEDKIAMTRKYLENYAGRLLYGQGLKKPNVIKGGMVCEVRLGESYAQPAQLAGIGAAQQIDETRLRESIKKELEAEWDKREYKRLREELDKERREFNAEKNSAIGLLTNYLAPIGKALLEKKVAGLDGSAPVSAEPVQLIETQEPDNSPRPFTDEEEEELYALLAEFKQYEPQYLELLRAVVNMAKSGDSTYNMAKGFLVK